MLGGGQLGRMLGEAGASLGFSFTFLEPADECPAAATGAWIRAPFEDERALDELAARSDVVTYEFENVPVAAVRRLAGRCPVHPPAASLETAQDRLAEKTLFDRLGIPTPPYAAVADAAGVTAALRRTGPRAVLKTRRMGYDGRGQRRLEGPADVAPALAELGGRPLLIETRVAFEREVSLLAARDRTGAVVCYPPVENAHRDGILRRSRAPAPGLAPARRAEAEGFVRRLLESLDHVGVLALELFLTADGWLANEIAPRVHNSGHWTIEGAETSQFENHLRAIAGRPLGPAAARGHAAMVNLIGAIPDLAGLEGAPGVHVHRYGKQPRPGRKLGHVTVCADDPAALERALAPIAARLEPDGASAPAVTPRASG